MEPTQAAVLPAFQVDVNARTDGNRLWTITDDSVNKPIEPGAMALAVCIESDQDSGFGIVCRVYVVRRPSREDTGWFISFDWLPEHGAPALDGRDEPREEEVAASLDFLMREFDRRAAAAFAVAGSDATFEAAALRGKRRAYIEAREAIKQVVAGTQIKRRWQRVHEEAGNPSGN